MTTFPSMAALVPPGQVGTVRVDHKTLTPKQASWESLQHLFAGTYWMAPAAGTYARLIIDKRLVMSDTPMEHLTNYEIVSHAHGDVLIFGLGLGMILHPLAVMPEVTSLTVVELNPDVISLIGPTLPTDKPITLIEGDALTWVPPPGQRYHTIYFDIWPTLDEDNLPLMGQLQRRAHRWKVKADPVAWVGCWSRPWLLKQQRVSRRAAHW